MQSLADLSKNICKLVNNYGWPSEWGVLSFQFAILLIIILEHLYVMYLRVA